MSEQGTSPDRSTVADPDEQQCIVPRADKRILLILAPHNPLHHIVKMKDVTRVDLEHVKVGTYFGHKATFVLLDIKIQSKDVDVLELKVTFEAGGKSGRDKRTAQKTVSSMSSAQPAQAPNPSTAVKTRTFVESFRQSASSFASATMTALSCGGDPEASGNAKPIVAAVGPRIVYGPATLVNNEESYTHTLDPHIEGQGYGGSVGSRQRAFRRQYNVLAAPCIEVTRDEQGGTIRVEKARMGETRCPRNFQVGFVVLFDRKIRIKVTRGDHCGTDVFHQQAVHKQTLSDTITRDKLLEMKTCGSADCKDRETCAEFNEKHMTDSVWCQALTEVLRTWDYDGNDNLWAHYFRP